MLQDDAAATRARPLGAGVILFIVMIALGLLIGLWSYPRGIVVRTLVSVSVFLVYLTIVLVLLLMPRESAGEPESDILTDPSTLLRILFVVVLSFFCCGGLGCVVATHMAVPMRPPVVKEAEAVEVYRLRA